MAGKLEAGAFVELRGRPWLVEETINGDGDFGSLKLSCIADDAQGRSGCGTGVFGVVLTSSSREGSSFHCWVDLG